MNKLIKNEDGTFSYLVPFDPQEIQTQIDGLNSQKANIDAAIAPLQGQLDAYNALLVPNAPASEMVTPTQTS